MPSEFLNKLADKKKQSGDSLVKRYSRIVGNLKITMILFAVMIMLVIIIVPMFKKQEDRFELTFDHITTDLDEKPTMINPKFQGMDKDRQSFNVTADEAVQISDDNIVLSNVEADVSSKDGNWYNIVANAGKLNLPRKNIDLNGSVTVYMDSGYEFFTESAHINLDENVTTGNEPIMGQGTLGTLNAKGFIMRGDNNSILFYGGVRLTIFPDSEG